MHKGLHALVAGAFALVWSSSALASPREFDVVNDHVCIVGHQPAHSRHEWRVQLGVFRKSGDVALKRALEARGLGVESLTPLWMSDEYSLLSSPAFPSRAAARRAARRYQLAGIHRPFARRFRLLFD
jgi:hypothetical protein